MVYRVIGLMSGSSLDGLDIVFVELEETGGKWSYEIKAADCYPYEAEWSEKLKHAIHLNAYEYLLLHSAYGKFTGEKINQFIADHHLFHRVQLIASHGHTTFHDPKNGMTAQLGDGAAIAAVTGINVVSDLRAMDVALGGEGAPIVPMGEKLLFKDFSCFLNLGGIANISINKPDEYIAFDVCPANRVLNMLAQEKGKAFDANGEVAAAGKINTALLTQLNALRYYQQPFPKSLSNNFGTEVIFPIIQSFQLSPEDALRTYSTHIVQQIGYAFNQLDLQTVSNKKILVTGGGALNNFLIKSLKDALAAYNIEVVVPEKQLIEYKEALIMALLGVLRWREENTVLNSVTGAKRSSIGGAVWIGQEA